MLSHVFQGCTEAEERLVRSTLPAILVVVPEGGRSGVTEQADGVGEPARGEFVTDF
jgi:hypothetical protein